jgi:hypothetical protein
MYDDALRRKMQNEFAGIESTTFWNEYLKAVQGHRRYHTQTLEKWSSDRDIAKAQGGVAAIDKILRMPSDLTGVGKPPENKE